MDKKRKTTLSPLSDKLKLQCPPSPNRFPNGLYYYPTKFTLQGSSSIYHSIKDGMAFGSFGKEAVNFTLLSGSQRENPEKNKCELLKQQILECMQTEYDCNHLCESYLRQCSL
jgi:hypothetical protein